MATEYLKHIPFEMKQLTEEGRFIGMASVYGNIDHGNDVVEQGAFDEAIAQYGQKVRLMSAHKVAIGVATIRSTTHGLEAIGEINLKKQSGIEAYSDLKFYQEKGLPMGMSIGYTTKEADPPYKTKDGARHIKKGRVWEVTVTEFPMNELAEVLDVKAGRVLSKPSREAIGSAIMALQSFLDTADADKAAEAEGAAKTEAKIEASTEAKEPTDTSAVVSLIDDIRSLIPKN